MIGMFFGYFNHFRHWFILVDVLEVDVPLVHPYGTVGADDADQLDADIGKWKKVTTHFPFYFPYTVYANTVDIIYYALNSYNGSVGCMPRIWFVGFCIRLYTD